MTQTSDSTMLWLSYLGSGSSSRMPLALLPSTRSPESGADRAMPEMSRAIDPAMHMCIHQHKPICVGNCVTRCQASV